MGRVWEENNRKKNEENILKLIVRKKKKLKKITFSYRIFTYIFISVLTVVEALREQEEATWKGNGDDFVFQNTKGRPIHRHTINRLVIKPTLESLGILTPISIKDTRSTFITNALDQNERLSYIQKQVGHTTTRMIVDHYYRHMPAPDDGAKLEKAWQSTSILPE
jgi:integrase